MSMVSTYFSRFIDIRPIILLLRKVGNSLVARISACQVLLRTARGGPGFNSPLPSIFLNFFNYGFG